MKNNYKNIYTLIKNEKWAALKEELTKLDILTIYPSTASAPLITTICDISGGADLFFYGESVFWGIKKHLPKNSIGV